jgi:hypothetical protein
MTLSSSYSGLPSEEGVEHPVSNRADMASNERYEFM